MSDIEIRPAVADDAGAMLTVQRAAYVAEAQTYGDPFVPALVESAARIRLAIGGGHSVVLVAVAGQRLVGLVRAAVTGDTCVIARLAVAPDLQGRGIGTSLLTAVERAAGTEITQFALFTGHLEPAGQRLWRRLGYTEVGRQRVAAHRIQVHMRKPVTGATAAPGDPGRHGRRVGG